MVTLHRVRLPHPYPDENCYSILCRYAVRTGSTSSSQVCFFLFGNTLPLGGLLYKPFRVSDVRRWNDGNEGSVLYGRDHSCLQYFSCFLDNEDSGLLKKCQTGMDLQTGQAKKISRKCGFMQLWKKHLWYCPECTREDFRLMGET